jgi:hypothetical protein
VSYRRDLGRVLLLREDLCGILEECKTYSGASTSVAGKRLVWTENPSATRTRLISGIHATIHIHIHNNADMQTDGFSGTVFRFQGEGVAQNM